MQSNNNKKRIKMSNFEVVVSYEKTQEDGQLKRVNEMYLVDAMTFTEAETKIIKEFEGEDIHIKSIKRAKLSEIFRTNEQEKFYKCKLYFTTLDERSGKEKKESFFYLVEADSLEQANKSLVDNMKNTMSDYELADIVETKIIDIL